MFYEDLRSDFLAMYTSGPFRANTVTEMSFFFSNTPILLIVTGALIQTSRNYQRTS